MEHVSSHGTGEQPEHGPERSGGPDAQLLSDLRHGVANSFQMLAGLMQIRIGAVDDGAVRRELDELASKVFGMAIVYRALEWRDGGACVAVHRVLNDLCGHHRNAARLQDVQLRCQAGELVMPLETALPLTVLASEIIAAALMRDRRADGGIIEVRLLRAEDRVCLEIVDDGFDLPPAPEPNAGGSLGWRIVNALAHQIGATLERSADDRRISLTLTPARRG